MNSNTIDAGALEVVSHVLKHMTVSELFDIAERAVAADSSNYQTRIDRESEAFTDSVVEYVHLVRDFINEPKR